MRKYIPKYTNTNTANYREAINITTGIRKPIEEKIIETKKKNKPLYIIIPLTVIMVSSIFYYSQKKEIKTTSESIKRTNTVKPNIINTISTRIMKRNTKKPYTIKPCTTKPTEIKPSTVKHTIRKPNTMKPNTMKQTVAKPNKILTEFEKMNEKQKIAYIKKKDEENKKINEKLKRNDYMIEE